MEIRAKAEHDPVTDFYQVDAYMRWALLAAEEVVGKRGLGIVLRSAGLERFIGNYPPNELNPSGLVTFGDYAALSAGLHNFFGRAGKSMVLRIGRLSARHGIEQQSAVFGIATLVASKLLPVSTQARMGMEQIQGGFRKLYDSVGHDVHMHLEDRGDKFAYVFTDCSICAGKQADEPMCWLFTGVLQEAGRWQTGKEFEIVEVECRAMGAPACVWEVGKTPKG
jgi:predicted hydrocarbon binding protein